MKCPFCDSQKTKVIDTRDTEEKVRRRRECSECEKRFTTYETVETINTMVVKKDGSEELFREGKLKKGIKKATKNTPITPKEIKTIVEEVKNQIKNRETIKAEKIGELVKEQLRNTNKLAYIRFASVYDSFNNIEELEQELDNIKD
jgi:transcriptional repressor NrdR